MKYPFVKQEGNKDCAVASLSMIIRYYKGYVAHEQLRDMLLTDKNGTSAYNIIKVSEYLGFKTIGIRTKNLEEITLPCIAHVTLNKQLTHFIVIYKIDFKKGEMLIADPASNLKKMKISDFNEITNNIFILFKPLKKIPYFKHTSIFNFVIVFLKNNRELVFKISLISFFINLFITMTSFSFKFIVESLNYGAHLKYIYFIIFLLLIALKTISTYLRNKLTIYLDKKIDFSLTNEIYQNIINFPYIYYCNRSTGEIISRINDLQLTKNFISKIVAMLFGDIPLIIISSIIMFSISSKLSFLTILMLILYFLIIKLFRIPLKNKIQEYQELRAKNTSLLYESISSYECIKGLSIENNIISKFKGDYYNYVDNISNFSNTYNIQVTLKDLVSEILSLVIILIGCLLINDNLITIGSLISFTYLTANFTQPIKELLDTNVELEESISALKRILELNYKTENNGKLHTLNNGDIIIRNLNYTYNNDKEILKNINIIIKKSEKVVILGPSGSGKSTILKVLKQYLKVKNGVVSINNYDINDYSKIAMQQVCYVAQNERLFTDTLFNNLKLNRNIITEKILEVIKLCKINEIIKDNSNLDMLIEEDGFNLSGGERQRIILARALLSNAEVILIDEGTNQLDISLERVVLKEVFKRFKDKTFIVVTHRNNNIDLFDHLVKIEEGNVLEDAVF